MNKREREREYRNDEKVNRKIKNLEIQVLILEINMKFERVLKIQYY